MYSKNQMKKSTEDFFSQTEKLAGAIETSDAVVIGAGAGLSAAAGFTYNGERFQRIFSDFHEKYGITDMYSGGFYPFDTLEEYWAWWSRHIYYNRYVRAPLPVYANLLKVVKDRNYFVITTNVDHQFQMAGFDKERLFYTQGDYGLWQCSKPCHDSTYDNEQQVRKMVAEQNDMKIPSRLVPCCPVCGAPMTMNLRCDDTFVEDDGWHKAYERYEKFIRDNIGGRILFLEIGIGANTPGVIKYPFMRMASANRNAVYACINPEDAFIHANLKKRSIVIREDAGRVIQRLAQMLT